MEVRPSQLLPVSPANPVMPQNRYRPGQFVMGTILKMLGNSQALVSIGGKQLTATIEGSLKTGIRYPFQVVREDPIGLLHLKLSTQSGLSSGNTADTILRQMGQPLTAQTRGLVSEMIEKNWPLVPSFIKEALELTKNVPNTKEAFSVLEELVSRDFPLNPDIFKAIQAAKFGPGSAALLSQLEELLSAESGELEPQVFEQIRKSLRLLGTNEGGTTSPLPQLLEKMGFFHEAMAARFVLPFNNFKDHQMKPVQSDLKGELIQLISELKGNESEGSHALHPAEQLLNKLTGQQLLSLTHDPEWLSLNVQVPIFYEGKQTEARVKWEIKKTPTGEFDPQFCRLVFHVNLTNLKETVLQMVIQNRSVTCNLYTEESAPIDSLTTQDYAELKNSLSALNFNLISFQHRVESVKEITEKLFHQTIQMDVSI